MKHRRSNCRRKITESAKAPRRILDSPPPRYLISPAKPFDGPRDDPARGFERRTSIFARATRLRHDERDAQVSFRALKRLARPALVESRFLTEYAKRASAQ